MSLNSEVRSLLLVPDGAINPKVGGGQRTIILFSALKKLGPVDVAILGSGLGSGEAVFFPGAASVRWVPSERFPVKAKQRLAWLRYNLQRFVFVPHFYGPEAQVSQALSEILTPAHRVIACRYALPFCVTGLIRSSEYEVFVDIDDRDDQKFLSAAKALFKNRLLSRLFEKAVVPAVRRQLRNRLREASFLWYATAEDDLEIDGVPTAILRNVPFLAEVPKGSPAPSDSLTVLFVGTYGHRPNQDGVRWFLRNCWPHIRAKHPQARFRIVGLGPWQELAGEFPGIDGVEYVGTVEDISQEYLQARLVVSPLFEGGGSKIKVIEACAFGRPAVVTTHSARGFGSEITIALPQADRPDDFIALCDAFLGNGGKADELGARLAALQQKHLSREATEAQIIEHITGIIETTDKDDLSGR